MEINRPFMGFKIGPVFVNIPDILFGIFQENGNGITGSSETYLPVG